MRATHKLLAPGGSAPLSSAPSADAHRSFAAGYHAKYDIPHPVPKSGAPR